MRLNFPVDGTVYPTIFTVTVGARKKISVICGKWQSSYVEIWNLKSKNYNNPQRRAPTRPTTGVKSTSRPKERPNAIIEFTSWIWLSFIRVERLGSFNLPTPHYNHSENSFIKTSYLPTKSMQLCVFFLRLHAIGLLMIFTCPIHAYFLCRH